MWRQLLCLSREAVIWVNYKMWMIPALPLALSDRLSQEIQSLIILLMETYAKVSFSSVVSLFRFSVKIVFLIYCTHNHNFDWWSPLLRPANNILPTLVTYTLLLFTLIFNEKIDKLPGFNTVYWYYEIGCSGSALACGAKGRCGQKFAFSRKSPRYAALGTGYTVTAVPRSTQPSILWRTANEYHTLAR